MSGGLRQWVRGQLAAAGYFVFNANSGAQYAQDSLFTTNSAHFREEPAFRAAYARGVAASAGVDPRHEWRVHVALWAAEAALRVPGDFVECGVNAGFVSSAILHHLDWEKTGRQYLLIDTFEGPVVSQFSAGEREAGSLGVVEAAMASGGYVTDLERVRANFAEWPHARVVPGVVPEVLGSLAPGPVAFLHLDMNCAYPERAALEWFWERMSPGGLILFDDYAYFGNRALAEGIDEAAAALGARVLALPTGQGLIIR